MHLYSTEELDKSVIRSRAKLECIADTWGDGTLRLETLDRLKNAGRKPKEEKKKKEQEFVFVVNDDIVYTTPSDFRDPENRQRIAKLMSMRKSFSELSENMEKMRIDYAQKGDAAQKKNLCAEILDCEQEYYLLESDIRQLEKAIRLAETKYLQ